LIENLQRQEIDPIDKANGIVSFILVRHADMDLNKIINERRSSPPERPVFL
jgi:hypothetical protein